MEPLPLPPAAIANCRRRAKIIGRERERLFDAVVNVFGAAPAARSAIATYYYQQQPSSANTAAATTATAAAPLPAVVQYAECHSQLVSIIRELIVSNSSPTSNQPDPPPLVDAQSVAGLVTGDATLDALLQSAPHYSTAPAAPTATADSTSNSSPPSSSSRATCDEKAAAPPAAGKSSENSATTNMTSPPTTINGSSSAPAAAAVAKPIRGVHLSTATRTTLAVGAAATTAAGAEAAALEGDVELVSDAGQHTALAGAGKAQVKATPAPEKTTPMEGSSGGSSSSGSENGPSAATALAMFGLQCMAFFAVLPAMARPGRTLLAAAALYAVAVSVGLQHLELTVPSLIVPAVVRSGAAAPAASVWIHAIPVRSSTAPASPPSSLLELQMGRHEGDVAIEEHRPPITEPRLVLRPLLIDFCPRPTDGRDNRAPSAATRRARRLATGGSETVVGAFGAVAHVGGAVAELMRRGALAALLADALEPLQALAGPFLAAPSADAAIATVTSSPLSSLLSDVQSNHVVVVSIPRLEPLTAALLACVAIAAARTAKATSASGYGLSGSSNAQNKASGAERAQLQEGATSVVRSLLCRLVLTFARFICVLVLLYAQVAIVALTVTSTAIAAATALHITNRPLVVC